MNKTSLERLVAVHPDMRAMITDLAKQFDAQFPGWSLEVSQGFRPSNEQAALFAQGRYSLATVNSLREAVNWAPLTEPENREVTNAAPGQSWHEFACAVDVVPESTEAVVDWDGNDDHWEFIVEAGEKIGMKSGISWNDRPHFQLAAIPTSPDQNTRYLFAEGGIDAVWADIPKETTDTQDV